MWFIIELFYENIFIFGLIILILVLLSFIVVVYPPFPGLINDNSGFFVDGFFTDYS